MRPFWTLGNGSTFDLSSAIFIRPLFSYAAEISASWQQCTTTTNILTGGFSCFCRQNPSRDLSRCSSREALDSGRSAGRSLESPSLLRRVIAGAGGSGGLADLDTPPASPTPFSYNSRSELEFLKSLWGLGT